MNFYIGNSISEINTSDDNVEFSDELIDFIYKLREKNVFDMDKLYEIDPYADVEISKIDLPSIIDVCNYILSESLLKEYLDQDEGIKMVLDLIQIAQRAMKENKGLVSIGD